MQNVLSSSLQSKNINTKIHRTIILPVVFYGCETWSLTLRKERRLRVFENRVLRRIFGPKREWRKLHNEKRNHLYCSPNILRVTKSKRMRWAGNVACMEKSRRVFWWGNLSEADRWEDPGVDGEIMLRWMFRKWDVGVKTGSSWLRIGTGGGHL